MRGMLSGSTNPTVLSPVFSNRLTCREAHFSSPCEARSMDRFLKAFPDIRLVTEQQFGAGDWITQLSHMRGTHTGPLEAPGGPTIPATNKSVRIPVALVARLEGGKFAEINLYFDQMGLMAQLGLAPQSPQHRRPYLAT